MNRPANPLRGEQKITIAGESFVLRPTFEALVAAETELGSLFDLVERASQGKLTIAEMAGLVWHCLPNEGRPERETVGQALLEMGLLAATNPVRAIFGQVLKGHA